MQSCKGKFCFEEGNYLMQTSLIVIVVIAAVIAFAIAAWYLRKSLLFSKGTYGKQTVKSILKRYALSRNYKVLENVTLNYEGKTQTIDFVLVGFFGLLFVSALQGKGDFYGDLKEPRWSFVDDEKKVRFDNPVLEMDKKIELFRRLMCNLVGSWVENGEYPNDEKALKKIVQGISYYNAKRYFRL